MQDNRTEGQKWAEAADLVRTLCEHDVEEGMPKADDRDTAMELATWLAKKRAVSNQMITDACETAGWHGRHTSKEKRVRYMMQMAYEKPYVGPE